MFLDGKTPYAISQILTAENIPTPAGKTTWATSSVQSILTNEKYKGDALLQKTFCTDFLTKKMKVNEGEVPQYYVENSHPAIVSTEMFDLVQQEMSSRKARKKQHTGTSIFSDKIICGCCGSIYGSKVWHSNDQYRRVVWQCNAKFKNEKKCTTPHLTEDEIKNAFVKAMNRLLADREFIIDDCKMLMEKLADNTALDDEERQLLAEMEVVGELLRKVIAQNASEIMDQDEYNKQFEALEKRYNTLTTRLDEISAEKDRRKHMRNTFRQFIKTIEMNDPIDEFTPEAWNALVESVTVYAKDDIRITLRINTKLLH